MERVVMPSIDVVRRGVLIWFTTKLDNISSGVLVVRNLNRNLALPTTISRVIGTPQMVFTNPITTTHVNKTIDRLLMN
jgi:hypothetical protein